MNSSNTSIKAALSDKIIERSFFPKICRCKIDGDTSLWKFVFAIFDGCPYSFFALLDGCISESDNIKSGHSV